MAPTSRQRASPCHEDSFLRYTKVNEKQVIVVGPGPDAMPITTHALLSKVRPNFRHVVVGCVSFDPPIGHVFGSQGDHSGRVLRCGGNRIIVGPTRIASMSLWSAGSTGFQTDRSLHLPSSPSFRTARLTDLCFSVGNHDGGSVYIDRENAL